MFFKENTWLYKDTACLFKENTWLYKDTAICEKYFSGFYNHTVSRIHIDVWRFVLQNVEDFPHIYGSRIATNIGKLTRSLGTSLHGWTFVSFLLCSLLNILTLM